MRGVLIGTAALVVGLSTPLTVTRSSEGAFALHSNSVCADDELCTPLPNSYCGGAQSKKNVNEL